MEINERVIVEYNDKEKQIYECDKEEINIQIKRNKLSGKSEVFPNQQLTGFQIIEALRDRKIINVMVIAQTQSGKTGTMVSLINNFVTHPDNLIPLENIYIITGLSNTDWVKQTKERMPASLEKRVFHQNNLTNKFIEDIKHKKNVFVIMDEIQIAAQEKQTLFNSFQKAGFYDKQELFKRDVKIIEFTATPDGAIYDVQEWKENAKIIKMEPGKNYIGCYDLFNQGRVKQFKTLKDKKNVKELKEVIDKNYINPRYHIIRVANNFKNIEDNFKEIFQDSIIFINYFQCDTRDINEILQNSPIKHTVIFIKEKLRCAKTIIKKYLGILYERFTDYINDAVIIQGLIGRGTGYDDNGDSKIFSNIDSIKRYQKLWESNFEDKSVKWLSRTTIWSEKNKKLEKKSTYLNVDNINGKKHLKDKINKPKEEPYETYQQAFERVKDLFGHTSRPTPFEKYKEKNLKADGFYYNYLQGKKEIMSVDYVKKNISYNIDKNRNKNKYHIHACYENINDKNTLCFILAYIENK